MNFGNMGFMEILLILVVVLLLFGARRLPEIGASFGKSIKEFKKGISEVDRSIKEEPRDTFPQSRAEPVRQDNESQPEPKRLLS
jgi:sec-independent protein translocase protein TatA